MERDGVGAALESSELDLLVGSMDGSMAVMR
jgi:hypothetical protein